jgi:hypothetical protein
MIYQLITLLHPLFFLLKMTFLLAMYLTIHNKIRLNSEIRFSNSQFESRFDISDLLTYSF